ncbi:MAG: tetratricopeptide repeat protein [Leptolyngbyaceae cyanobacterium CRU_2_3]|nr:tetratricopeptide repeat protein [Leptolyngbyaceae cyanobacterium CRU_2_3]
MKKNPPLGALENVSIAGLVIGSVASIVSKQIFYTTMPLTALAVLGWLNRRQFENTSRMRDLSLAEMDHKLSKQIDLLNQQVAGLPSTETVHLLRQGLLMKDREVASRLYAEITAVQQEMNQRLKPLEQQELESAREIDQLEGQYQQIATDLTRLGTDFQEFVETTQAKQTETAIAQLQLDVDTLQTNLDSFTTQAKPNFTSLQEQILRLDRQLGKLPPPVDLSSLKQEFGELVRMIADLVPRRDLLALVNEVRGLHQQQEQLKQSVVAIETASITFNSVFVDLLKSMDPENSASPDRSSLRSKDLEEAKGLEAKGLEQVTDLGQEITEKQGFQPSAKASADRITLQKEAAHYLEHLRSQLSTIHSFTQSLAEQNQQLQAQINQLPKSLDVAALQSQLRELSQRIPAAENTLDGFRYRIQEVVQQELQYISQQLQSVSASPHYELVFDLAQSDGSDAHFLTGSRAILEEALASTQERLILILPWADQCSLDQALLQKLEAFLNQGRRLDIGWCHFSDRNAERLLKKLRRGWMSNLSQQDTMQETLHNLLHLKRTYPQQFQFKILGTGENFLVSDRTFAVLGIAEGLKTSTTFPELQLKLRTRDSEVIQRLISRFDNPVLETDDLVAYWNRGVTRHDLGDKVGAIADYTQILRFNPEDAITYNYRGIVHYEIGEIGNAIEGMTESIRLHPRQAAAYCNRGFMYLEQGELEKAIADYTQAVDNRPDWAIAFFYRGMAWQKLGNHQKAITDYGEAIYLAPDSAVCHYYRGLTWQKLRNYLGAIEDLGIAAELFETQGSTLNAQKVRKSLAKLRQPLVGQPNGTVIPFVKPAREPSSLKRQNSITPDG